MKKIIPCLDIKDGRVVKGVKFVNLEDIGDPVELASHYSDQGADELVFLNITRTQDGHDLMLDVIQQVTSAVNIPLTVGGGIQTLQEAEAILNAGATKISISSAAVKTPQFINELSYKFGSESITVAIDAGYDAEARDYFIYTHGGAHKEAIKLFDWVKEVAERGAGSLLITSIENDGVREGFDIKSLKKVSELVSIPVIASGGAGATKDFVELFKETNVQAGLAASIFHKSVVSIPKLKQTLANEGIEVR